METAQNSRVSTIDLTTFMLNTLPYTWAHGPNKSIIKPCGKFCNSSTAIPEIHQHVPMCHFPVNAVFHIGTRIIGWNSDLFLWPLHSITAVLIKKSFASWPWCGRAISSTNCNPFAMALAYGKACGSRISSRHLRLPVAIMRSVFHCVTSSRGVDFWRHSCH